MKEYIIDCYVCGESNQKLKRTIVVYNGIKLISLQTNCTECYSLLYNTKCEKLNNKLARYINKRRYK